MLKKIMVVSVLMPWLTALGWAQGSGDCALDDWSQVIGAPVASLQRGECGYEVEDWETPSYLEMEIGSVLAASQGLRIFRCKLELANLQTQVAGEFVPFQWVTEDGSKIVQLELFWKPLHNTSGSLVTLRSRMFPHARFGSMSFPQVFGQGTTTDTQSPINIEILWNPSDPGAYNGWLELRVNGAYQGRINDIDLDILGPRAQGSVRYGYIEVLGNYPIGTFRIVPQNPTPYHPHL